MRHIHPECYGRMTPDLSRLGYNQRLKGQAFSLLASSQGIDVQILQMDVNTAGWEKCLNNPYQRTCDHLSTVKRVCIGRCGTRSDSRGKTALMKPFGESIRD